MPDERVKDLVEQRVALETKLQQEKGALSEARIRAYDDDYSALQRKLAGRFTSCSS